MSTLERSLNSSTTCCGGPAPNGSDACCVKDADAKASGRSGCGCATVNLPVAIVGAGPVGLAAAAHLIERGIEPLILEAGPSVGANLSDHGHVRLFSPWRCNPTQRCRPCGARCT